MRLGFFSSILRHSTTTFTCDTLRHLLYTLRTTIYDISFILYVRQSTTSPSYFTCDTLRHLLYTLRTTIYDISFILYVRHSTTSPLSFTYDNLRHLLVVLSHDILRQSSVRIIWQFTKTSWIFLRIPKKVTVQGV